MQIKRKLSIKRRGDQKYLIFGLQKRAHTVGREEERKEEEKRRRRRRRRRRRGQEKVRKSSFCMELVWFWV